MSESGQRPESPVERVREVLETVGEALGLDADVQVEQDEEGIRGVLEGDDLGLFIGRHGQTIDAVQQTVTGSSGLFTFWRSYNIPSVIDGLSNTVAFAEALVGDKSSNWTRSAGIVQLGTLPATAEILDASSNLPAIQVGLQACSTAWTNRSGKLNTGRGNFWFHGTESQTMPAPACTAKVASSATRVRMAMARSMFPDAAMVPTAPP